MKKNNSRTRRHEARKRMAMARGQYAAIVPGRGMNPLAFVDIEAGLIRVTRDGIYLYR